MGPKTAKTNNVDVTTSAKTTKFNGGAYLATLVSHTTVVMVPSKNLAADTTIIPALATVIVVLLAIITIAGNHCGAYSS